MYIRDANVHRTASFGAPLVSDERAASGCVDTLYLKYEQICGRMEKSYASLCDFSKLMKSKIPPRSIRGIERLETDDLACSKFSL